MSTTQIGEIKTNSETGCLGVHTITHRIMCTYCCQDIASGRVAGQHFTDKHASTYHPGIIFSRGKANSMYFAATSLIQSLPVSNLKCVYENAPFENANTKQGNCGIMEPLAFLKVMSGYQCSTCPFCASTEATMKKHLAQEHLKSDIQINLIWIHIKSKGSVHLQTIRVGNATRFFPVKHQVHSIQGSASNPISSRTNTCETAVSKAMIINPIPLNPVPSIFISGQSIPSSSSPSSANSIKSILKLIMNPDTPLSSEHQNMATSYIALGKWDKILDDYGVSMETAYYYNSSCKERNGLETTIVEDMKIYMASVEHIVTVMHPGTLAKINMKGDYEFQLVSKSCREKYAQLSSRIIICAYRLKDQNSKFLSFVQSPSLSKYIESLSSPNTATRMTHLHNVLKSILLYHSPTATNIREMFVRFFITVSMVKGIQTRIGNMNYQFVEGHEVSHLLSSLQYLSCCCCIQELKLNATNATGEKEIIDLINVNTHSAAGFIKTCLTFAMRSVHGEDGSLEFEDCHQHQADICGVVCGVHFSLRQSGSIVKSLHENIELIFKEKLLFNNNLPSGFISKLASLSDELRNKNVGYGVLSNPRHQDWITKNTEWMFSTLRSNPISNSRLFFQPSSDSIGSSSNSFIRINDNLMHRKGIENWINACQDVQHALIVAIHLSSGLPARGTEIETFNIINTSSNTRNLYVSQGDTLILARYGKGRATRRYDKPIIRFPDKDTSKYILTYLTLFRGLETVMVQALDGPDAMKRHWQTLFVNRGSRISSATIRTIVATTLQKHGFNLRFNHIRHLATGLARRISHDTSMNTELETILYNIAHNQAGHSVSTAENRYAVRSTELSRFSYEEMNKSRAWCSRWHLAQGLSPCQGNLSNNSRLRQSSPYPTESRSISLPDVEKLTQCIIQKCTEQFSEKINSLIDKKMKHIHANPSQNDVVQPTKRTVGNFDDPRQAFISTMTMVTSSIDVKKYRAAIRSITNNQNADYRNQLQLSITAAIHENKDNLLIIMPTGFGKSFCFFIPIYMEQKSKCTVLVVPLVSLIQHLKEKATEMHLSVGGWEDRKKIDDFQLFIISAEHIETMDFRTIITKLQDTSKLTRIIFDEAHIILNWKDFRIPLRNIRASLLGLNIRVPIILLTATCPPEYRKQLISKFAITHASIFKAPTVRKNLSYRVVKVEETTQNGRFITSDHGIILSLCTLLSTQIANIKSGCQRGGRIMIFCMTRTLVDNLFSKLTQCHPDLSILSYHSGHSPQARADTQQNWMTPLSSIFPNSLRIIISTSSFGTGIDTPNVRTVYHAGGAYSLLDYLQESGRAGRDNLPSDCIILYCPKYCTQFQNSILNFDSATTLNEEESAQKLEKFNEFVSYIQSTTRCRKDWLFSYVDGEGPGFCDLDLNSANCDYCDQLNNTGSCSSSQQQQQNSHITLQPSQNIEQEQDDLILQSIELYTEKGSQPTSSPPIYNKTSNTTNSPNLNDFRVFAQALQSLCVPCLVLESKQVSHQSCQQSNFRCIRCFATDHRVSSCSQASKLNQHCARCFLRSCDGVLVHTAGFSSNCPFQNCRNLCWMLWNSEWRNKVASTLFTGKCLQSYYMFLTTNDEKNLRDLFDKWIQTIPLGTTPNIILLCLWWNKQTSFKIF